jgi:hypothetical protein
LAGESFVATSCSADAFAKVFLLIIVEKHVENEEQESNNGNDAQKDDVQFNLKQPTNWKSN